MGMSVRGPRAICVGSRFTFSISSIASPSIPKALRGAGHSFQSEGTPALARDCSIIWSKCTLVSARRSALNVQSQSMCSVVSSRPNAQCGQILSLTSTCGVLMFAEFSRTCARMAPVMITSNRLWLIGSSCPSG